jgi:hypothetical protein
MFVSTHHPDLPANTVRIWFSGLIAIVSSTNRPFLTDFLKTAPVLCRAYEHSQGMLTLTLADLKFSRLH